MALLILKDTSRSIIKSITPIIHRRALEIRE